MPRKILIAETTREERIQIVQSALGEWGDECDGMSSSSGGYDKMYQPYIDGELELRECNRRAASESYVSYNRDRPARGCWMGY